MDSGNIILTTTARRYDFLSAIVGKDVIVKSNQGDWYKAVLLSVDISLNIVLCNSRAVNSSVVNKEALFVRSDSYMFIGQDNGGVIIEAPHNSRTFNATHHFPERSSFNNAEISGNITQTAMENREYVSTKN